MADAHKALGGDAHKREAHPRFYEARVASIKGGRSADKPPAAAMGIIERTSAVAAHARPSGAAVDAGDGGARLLSPAVSTPGGAAGAGTEGMASLTNISSPS